ARKDKRSVQVTLSVAGDPELGAFAKLTATNTGHRPVVVTTIALELPSGGRFFSVGHGAALKDTPLPATLSDGQSAHIYLPYREIVATLVTRGQVGATKLTPVCEDAGGGVCKGKASKFDPVEFARK